MKQNIQKRCKHGMLAILRSLLKRVGGIWNVCIRSLILQNSTSLRVILGILNRIVWLFTNSIQPKTNYLWDQFSLLESAEMKVVKVYTDQREEQCNDLVLRFYYLIVLFII